MTAATGLPEAVRAVGSLVEERIGSLLDQQIARWDRVDPALGEVLVTLRAALLAGGKRLRAALCHWAFVGVGGPTWDRRVLDAGAALELVHGAALLHDDLIDASDRRHGRPALHVEQAEVHRGRAWRGSPTRFGAGLAVLLGDLAAVYGESLLTGAPPEALAVFTEMRVEVNLGQVLDVLGSVHPAGPGDPEGPERARRIIRYKTAKYTVERPLHLGAALAAPERFGELAEPLSEFALPLGEAFQLRDDLLGVFGDPAVTGKPVGEDLREGKPTLLASLAASRVAGPDAARFTALFGSPGLDEGGVQALRQIIEATGARAEVDRTIAGLLDQAKHALGRLPLSAAALEVFGEVVAFMAGRNS